MGWFDGNNWGGGWFSNRKRTRYRGWRPKSYQPLQGCYVQDAWTQRQGHSAYDRASQSFDDEIDAADFFSVAFEPYPEFASMCSRPAKKEFCSLLMQHPQFTAMRSQTKLDVTASQIVAAEFAEIYKKFSSMDSQKGRGGEGKGQGDEDEDQDGEGEGEGQDGEGQGKGRQGGDPLTKEEKECIEQEVQGAMTNAQKSLDEKNELGNAFGSRAGKGEGYPSQGEIDTFLNTYKLYKETAWLKSIVKFAGRMIHVARSRQKARTRYGADAFRGVEPGDSVERLLPEELAAIGMEDEVELEALNRLIEGDAQCLETYGTSQAGQGPIILLVDESGSMEGFNICRTGWSKKGLDLTKYEQAMGIALTVAWMARSQNRWVGLYTFMDGEYTRKLILDPNDRKPNESEELMKWVTKFSGGGTDSYILCETVPSDVDKGLLGKVRGKADILVVSDGDICPHRYDCARDYVNHSKSVADKFNAWKTEHDIKVKGLLVGTKDPGFLKYVSDELHYADSMLEGSEIAEAVFSVGER